MPGRQGECPRGDHQRDQNKRQKKATEIGALLDPFDLEISRWLDVCGEDPQARSQKSSTKDWILVMNARKREIRRPSIVAPRDGRLPYGEQTLQVAAR